MIWLALFTLLQCSLCGWSWVTWLANGADAFSHMNTWIDRSFRWRWISRYCHGADFNCKFRVFPSEIQFSWWLIGALFFSSCSSMATRWHFWINQTDSLWWSWSIAVRISSLKCLNLKQLNLTGRFSCSVELKLRMKCVLIEPIRFNVDQFVSSYFN